MADIPQANLDQIRDAVLEAPIEHPFLKTADDKPIYWPLRKAVWSGWFYSYFGYNLTADTLKAAQGDDFDEAAFAEKVAGPLAAAIAAQLPTGAITAADVQAASEAALRAVLGSVDNPPAP